MPDAMMFGNNLLSAVKVCSVSTQAFDQLLTDAWVT